MPLLKEFLCLPLEDDVGRKNPLNLERNLGPGVVFMPVLVYVISGKDISNEGLGWW